MMPSALGALVNRYGLYVENLYHVNEDYFIWKIWIIFGPGPCCWRTLSFLKLTPWIGSDHRIDYVENHHDQNRDWFI